MDFHLDRRVILSTESDFENLYKWSLQELDVDGKKIGRDQIPWAWNLYFMATELALLDEFEIGRDYDSDDGKKKAVREQQYITAKLSPGSPSDRRAYRNTAYSMFGTDRAISDFLLRIYPTSEEQKQGSCTVWGCVSYTTEVDFIDETEPDVVQFYLFVHSETFARYAEKIAASEVDLAVLRVSQVAGFYSDWSPAISTNSIKVLTKDKEHEVDIPKDCEIVPPRLGEVGEAQLYLYSINKIKPATGEMPDEDDEWLDKEKQPDGEPDAEKGLVLDRVANASARTVNLLSSLRIAAWIIAVLLLLILIK